MMIIKIALSLLLLLLLDDVFLQKSRLPVALVGTSLATLRADDGLAAVAMWFNWHHQQTSEVKSQAMQKFLNVHVVLNGGEGEESMSLSSLRHWLQVTLIHHALPPLPPLQPQGLPSPCFCLFVCLYCQYASSGSSHQ